MCMVIRIKVSPSVKLTHTTLRGRDCNNASAMVVVVPNSLDCPSPPSAGCGATARRTKHRATGKKGQREKGE